MAAPGSEPARRRSKVHASVAETAYKASVLRGGERGGQSEHWVRFGKTQAWQAGQNQHFSNGVSWTRETQGRTSTVAAMG